MKKSITVLTGALLLLALALTESLYVNWGELLLIISGITVISVLFHFPEDKKDKAMALSLRAASGFAFGWILCVADIFIDHLLYFQPTGKEDGAYLTLAFKLSEFSDTLFQISVICMATVFVLSMIFYKVLVIKKTQAAG